jgi:hypothetical protein
VSCVLWRGIRLIEICNGGKVHLSCGFAPTTLWMTGHSTERYRVCKVFSLKIELVLLTDVK